MGHLVCKQGNKPIDLLEVMKQKLGRSRTVPITHFN